MSVRLSQDAVSTIKVVQWNCEGATAALQLVTAEKLRLIDVIVLTETFAWRPFSCPGFYAVSCPARRAEGPGRPSGGVTVLYSSRVGRMEVLAAEDDCVVLRGEKVDVVAMYVRPLVGAVTLVEEIGHCLSLLDGARPIILAGDLNVRVDRPAEAKCEALMDLLRGHGMWVVSDAVRPTFEGFMGSSTIDLFATNARLENVNYLYDNTPLCELIGYRAHVPVGMDITLPVSEKKHAEKRVQYSRALDQGTLLEQAGVFFPLPEDPEPGPLHEQIARVILQSAGPRAPPLPPSRAWFDRNCFAARHRAVQVRILMHKWPCFTDMYARARREYRAVLKTCRERYYKRLEKRLVAEAAREPHRWLRTARLRVACPIDSDTLREHFRAMFTSTNSIPSEIPIVQAAWTQELELHRSRVSSDFSIQEVAIAIRRLPTRKAPGPDGVCNEHIRQAECLLPVWTTLMNACLRRGEIPPAWRESLLAVIPKGKGSLSDPKSWRGIAKKSCPYKLMSGLLTARLSYFLERLQVIPQEQHGFRAGRSTMTACKTLMNDIERYMRRGLFTYAVFVDFRAAFDMAPRDLVLQKLAHAGVPENILALLLAILQGNSVIVEDGVSELPAFVQTTGVAQGDNLSPLLFTVLTSHLPAILQGRHSQVKVLMYADDLVLYSTSRFHLQRSLTTLASLTPTKQCA